MTLRPTHLALAALLAAAGAAATASPIEFQFTGAGSGTIGSTSFTDASFTITELTDTAAVATAPHCACLYADSASASIDIAGVGAFTFFTGTRTFINGGTMGFSRAGADGTDLLDAFFGDPVVGYRLANLMRPVGGPGGLLTWADPDPDIFTTGGALFFDSGPTATTFTGFVPAAVPEPAGGVLMLAGLAMAAVASRRGAR